MTPVTTGPARPAPTHGAVHHRRLQPLGYRSCVELLTGRRIGRVIYTDAAMPAAQPVTYGIDNDDIIFITDQGSVLDRAVSGAVVAFEADDIDDDTQTGWSVLAIGQAYRVTDPERVTDLDRRIPRSTWTGTLTTTIAIPITQITGRRLPTTTSPTQRPG
jgi:nitroimidazol reductase NimA-like FMN-containing flavoprotein (pyridoxamine 5'-phosphate oxidase superfamily)